MIVELLIDSDLFCFDSSFSFSGDAVIVFYFVKVEVVDYVTKTVFNFVMVECL